MNKVTKSHMQNSKLIALEIIDLIKEKPDAVICLPSGSSPLEVFKILINQLQKIDYSKVKFVQLDEFLGLSKDDDGSCYFMLQRDFFDYLNIPQENIIFFDGSKNSVVDEFENYANNIEIDYILLGVGQNGHVGLNEPNSKSYGNIIVVDLDDVTKKVMTKYFTKEPYPVVTKGISLSLSKIKKSNMIRIIIYGEAKKIVKKILANEKLPVTQLLEQKNAIIFIDKEIL